MSGDDDLTGYLNAEDAAALDGELMSTPGFALEQLMELAGLSVAEAVYQAYPSSKKILVVCGPGNNGGDGLVAARHLALFGKQCKVVYPKRSKGQHFTNLVKQCGDFDIEVVDDMPPRSEEYDVVIDAVFGFSFKGAPREPLASALNSMIDMQKQGVKVVSVDIPSGWNVDQGDVSDMGFVPDVLVSLTAPKLSAKNFPGRHFVGGRFLPPRISKKYNVKMPPYPGTSQVMEIPRGGATPQPKRSGKDEEWAIQYAQYLHEKERKEGLVDSDLESNDKNEDDNVPHASSDEKGGGWEGEYAKYCAEKEKRDGIF